MSERRTISASRCCLLASMLFAWNAAHAAEVPQSVVQLNDAYQVVKQKHLDTWVGGVKTMADAAIEYHKLALLAEMGGIESQIKAFASANPLVSESTRIARISEIIAAAPVRNKIRGFSLAGLDADNAFTKAIDDVGRQLDGLSADGIATADVNLLDRQFGQIGETVARRLAATMDGLPIQATDIDNLDVRGLGAVKREALKGYFSDLDAIKSDLPNGLTTAKWASAAGKVATVGGGVLDGLNLASSTITIASGTYNVSDVWSATSATAGLVSLIGKTGGKVAAPIALIEGVRSNTENWTKLASLLEDARHWEVTIADPNETYLNPLQMQQFYKDMAQHYVTEWTVEFYALEKAVDERNLGLLTARIQNLVRTRDGARELKHGDTKGYLNNFSWAAWLGLSVPADVINSLEGVAEPSPSIDELFDYYRQKLRAEEIKDALAYFAAQQQKLDAYIQQAKAAPTTALPVMELVVPDTSAADFNAATGEFVAKKNDHVIAYARNGATGFSALTGDIAVYFFITGGTCPGTGVPAGQCVINNGLLAQADAVKLRSDGGLEFVLPADGTYRLIAVADRASGYTGTPLHLVEAPAAVVVTEAEAASTGSATRPLNDTGITAFANASSNSLTTEPADYPGQDARYGRDAQAAAGTLAKTGAGSKGFDFSKIANDGAALPDSAALGSGASDWACTRDNVTGLMWEVKATAGLRSQSHSYTWYDSNSASNGGSAGTSSGGSCATSGRCDTEKFVADVNAAGLCGHSDWRLPRYPELLSIVDYGRVNPAIDPTWFPNTPASDFWSASAYAGNSYYAWYVHFSLGFAGSYVKYDGFQVRLVRAGQ